MKKTMYKLLSFSFVALVFFSCKPNIDVPKPVKGNLDVSKFVSIGNSITSGYADNALYADAQLNSYPNLIAQQLKLAGGGDFKQPMVGSTSVGIGSSLNARFLLAPLQDCQGVTSLSPVPVAQQGDLSIFGTSVAAQGPFNNMGVPGAKAIYVPYAGYGNPSNGQGNYNPYFTRMATDPTSASILSDAMAQNPTFFSLDIGEDDMLAFALAGGAAESISSTTNFNASIDAVVGTLTSNGAKGAVANIPSINSLPYFTTIPYNGLLLDKNNADALSAAYAPLGISFHEGYNPFIIEDGSAPGQMRQIQEGEMILLSIPQDSLKCGGWGSMKPIPNQYVLTSNEISQINDATEAFNAKLKATADAKGLAFVDVNAFMKTVKTGMIYNGVALNAGFVTGGAFSLDGINLTPLGNALLANEYIKAINSKYGSSIPQVNATNYKGVAFP